MTDNLVLVFDLETMPDVHAFATAEGLEGHPDWSVRKQMGEKVARQVFQRVVCLGSLLAGRGADGVWRPSELEAPHLGQRSERELIQDFVDRLATLGPRLVTFNGHTFDLPVLRYRAMMHAVCAPGLEARRYFDRAGADMVDLCDLLSAGERHARVSLNELARVLGLPGKPPGIDGAAVETLFGEGRHAEIADYCRSDVINTYRAWLRYELFCGRLSEPEFAASEADLAGFLARAKPVNS
ncbi:MAG: ribonuclease H-like domain-containing protein [Reyranellales bacterium]